MEKFSYRMNNLGMALNSDVENGELEKLEITTTYNNSLDPSSRITLKGIYKDDSFRVSSAHFPKEHEITLNCEEQGLSSALGMILETIAHNTPNFSIKADKLDCGGIVTRYSITFE